MLPNSSNSSVTRKRKGQLMYMVCNVHRLQSHHTQTNPNTGTPNINPHRAHHTPSVKIIAKYGLLYMPYSQYSALCWRTVLGNPWYSVCSRARIFKRLRSPAIGFKESIPQIRAGIFKKSMGARHRGGIGFSYRPARLHRLARNSFLGINSGAP